MQIEKISISKLNPAQYNPRVRLQPGDAEYEKLKRSIQTFGYIDPIIINADGTIIGGHQRYYVLLDLGYDEIDVVKLDLDENEERALNVALNKISGEWDEEKLKDLLKGLRLDDYDFTVTGFEEDELDADHSEELRIIVKLKKLESLSLSSYGISDVSIFSDMKELKELTLGNNKISDVGALLKLKKLESLGLHSNPITDLSDISKMTRLKKLNLSAAYRDGYDKLTDIQALSGLTDLEELNLYENAITDLEPLSGLTKLKILNLYGNPASDIEPLSGLTELTELDLSKSYDPPEEEKIGSIRALSGMTKLEKL